MEWQAWAAVLGVGLSFVAMATGRAAADTCFGVVLVVLVLIGVLPMSQALVGFSNEQVHTVALLFVVASALDRSGALRLVTSRILIKTPHLSYAILRMTLPVASLSAVLNNTPIVAMLLPEVRAWARRIGVAPSRLLIPLSYAAILGGLVTLIGTSTNLVVNGLVQDAGKQGLGFFEIGKIGVPIALMGLLLLIPISRWLLPDRSDLDEEFSNPNSFVTEVVIEADCCFVGKPLSELRLDQAGPILPVELIRGEAVLPAPRAEELIRAGDRLVFSGPAAQIIAIKQSPELKRVTGSAFIPATGKRVLVEVVLSSRARILGTTVGDGNFRKTYNAAIVAVARDGARVVSERIEDWQLRQGDVLLVECGHDFLEKFGGSGDFYLVTPRGDVATPQTRDAIFGVVVLVAMVGAAALAWVSMLEAVIVALAALYLGGFVPRDAVRSVVDFRLLLAIALAFGLGRALEVTGAAAHLATQLTNLGGDSAFAVLCLLYLGTSILTEVITNNAAAAIAVPLALAAAERMGVSHLPFVVAVMVAASTSFATPLGYQTNLMVYGPGNYRFVDFLRAGLVMNLVVAAVAVALIPRIWPF